MAPQSNVPRQKIMYLFLTVVEMFLKVSNLKLNLAKCFLFKEFTFIGLKPVFVAVDGIFSKR